ncbi:auxin efflux carrier [Tirmania nivea]|nr:auxin efflux carrier [Tirmania nivea]
MANSEITVDEVIFTSVKPIIKMAAIALGGGIFARMGVLTPEACRANATLIMSMLLPLMIFSTVVPSFDPNNMAAIFALVLSGVVYMVMGLTFGLIVRWLTPIPVTWKGGIVAAGLLGNWGDLVIGYISTLTKSQPFQPQDADLGTAYCSIFMIVQIVVLYNLGGLQLIKRDFDHRPRTDLEKSSGHKLKAIREAPTKGTDAEFQVPHLASRLGAMRRRVSSIATQRPIGYSQAEPQDSSQQVSNCDDIAIEEVDYTPTPFSNISTVDVTQRGSNNPNLTVKEKVSLGRRVWLAFKSLLNPPSVSLIVSIIIANVQPLKALFIHTDSFSVKDAPDQKPPLDFIMEITRFAGPSVPVLGLVLLGAAFSRMSIKSLPKGFWKSIILMAIFKLIITKGPIIGMVWTTQLAKNTPLIPTDDKILQFVMIMTSGTPSATSQIYLTTIFAPPDKQGSVEMSALSALLLAQYAISEFYNPLRLLC